MGREGERVIRLYVHVTYAPTVSTELTQLKLTATIYEVNNVRSSHPRTVAAYNWFSSFI